MRVISIFASLVIAMTALVSLAATPRPIAERDLTRLQTRLTEALALESTTERRRAYKRLSREAESLLEEKPKAPNRFTVLAILFRVQQERLVMRNTDRNREAIPKTCRRLLDAPDEYADERLPADALLMRLELKRKGATAYERVVAIAKLADRYRDTAAEVESLIIASELAFQLGEGDLLKAFRRTLGRKFRENPRAIGFLKERFNTKSSSLIFRGRFKQLNGDTLVLPMDRAGHIYVSCFWSKDTRELKQKLMEIRALQDKFPGEFEVLSFNLDELPDAGRSILKRYKLDWRPLHLKGGRENALFKALSFDTTFLARVINLNGYTVLTPTTSTPDRWGKIFNLEGYFKITMDKPQYRAVVQSIRIGEFLVADLQPPKGTEIPADKLAFLQSCFVRPPMRHRVPMRTSLTAFRRLDNRSADLLADYPKDPAIQYVRNLRTVGLLARWNLTGDPKFMFSAVKEAKATIASKPSKHALLIANVCLAKAALREVDVNAGALIRDFVADNGGSDASASAIAAAIVLSLDAGSPVLFQKYQKIFLDDHLDDPKTWQVAAYVANKFVTGRLFRGNYHGSEVRVFHGFRSWQKDTEIRPRTFEITLNDLKGNLIRFPHANPDKSNVVMFMDLPKGDKSAKIQMEMMNRFESYAKSHKLGNVNYIAAFVSDDVKRVRDYVGRMKWNPKRIAVVPNASTNQQLTRLGVVMADERPNTFIVAADGTLVWSMTGMYQMAVGVNGVSGVIRDKVQEHDLATGAVALKNGDYARALKIYKEAVPDYRGKPQSLINFQRLSMARAHAGLKNWDEALKIFDAIYAEHQKSACSRPCACRSLARKFLARAKVNDALNRETDASADRARAKALACPLTGEIRFHPERYEQETFNRLKMFMARKEFNRALVYIDDVIVNGKDGRQKERIELAGLMREFAKILERTGDKPKATTMRQRAEALTQGITADAGKGATEKKKTFKYVDLIN